MNDLELKLNSSEINNVLLELLIKILAGQEALTSVLIELLGKDDTDKNELISLLSSEASENARKILYSLYERKGDINLKDILGK